MTVTEPEMRYYLAQVILILKLREVPGKSKWKFKMAFAMKGEVGREEPGREEEILRTRF